MMKDAETRASLTTALVFKLQFLSPQDKKGEGASGQSSLIRMGTGTELHNLRCESPPSAPPIPFSLF